MYVYYFFFFKQKTAYEMRISDWSSDVCSSDLFQMLQASVASELQRAKGGGRHGYQGYFCKPSHTPRHSEGRERAGWRSSRGTVCEPNGLRRAGRTDRKSTRLNSSH